MDSPGRHRQRPPSASGSPRKGAPGLSLGARRAIAAIAVGLAVGSSVVGVARGQASDLRASGTLVGTMPAASPTASPSAVATSTAPAKPTAAASTAPAKTSAPKPTAKASLAAKPKTPDSGGGKREPVRVPGADSSGEGRVVTYAFEVESGLKVDSTKAARIVGEALRDKRGWQGIDKVRFAQLTPQQRAAGKKPKITISLVSPDMTDKMCAPLSTKGTWSCANKDHAVLNLRRWNEAVPSYKDVPLDDYRRYLVNHEVGHELGHPHVACVAKGKPAPVMMQQSMGLQGCKPNLWPATTSG